MIMRLITDSSRRFRIINIFLRTLKKAESQTCLMCYWKLHNEKERINQINSQNIDPENPLLVM